MIKFHNDCMKIKGFLIKLLNGFENLFMTNHSCVCCTREIPDDTKFMICKNCKNLFEKISGNLCIKCGDVVPNENVKVCDYCKEKEYVFDNNFSCFYYNEISASIIKNFKYNSRKYYAKYIAELMIDSGYDFLNFDIITYVPMSSKRRKERGFNQSEELAIEISKVAKVKVVPLLTKIKEGEHQAKLNQSNRMKNLIGSFVVNSEFEKEIKGKRILIIDDVFTTGTTLNECAKAIKKFKPEFVKTFTFAKTKFNSIKF